DLAVLAATSSGSMPVILLGSGDGSFHSEAGQPLGGDPLSMAAGHFNGDGNLDVAAGISIQGGGTRTISIYYGNGDGTLTLPVSYVSGPYPSAIAVADFNLDRKTDLAVVSYTE